MNASPARRPGLTVIALFQFGFAFAIRAAGTDVPEIAAKLDSLKDQIATELTTRLSTNRFQGSYTTVWRQFEDAAIDALCDMLPQKITELGPKSFDRGATGHEKNRLADLAIVCGTNRLEVSIKATQRNENPENDMGTFRELAHRQQLFGASFTLWVRYTSDGKLLRSERVFFDRTWRFVGKSSLLDGVKYRKKDGNLRPKPWAMFDSGQSFWSNETDFAAAVKRSEAYRANELVKEYLTGLSEDDQQLLYERLKAKFGSHPTPAP